MYLKSLGMYLRSLVVLSLLLTTSAFAAPEASNVASIDTQPAAVSNADKQMVMKLFDKWNTALQTRNPQKVTQLYASDAILLPTVSNKVRHNRAEIKDYFVTFLKKKPSGVIDEANIRVIGDVAINSGIYTFKLYDHNVASLVKARYTFVYQKIGGKWYIIEHHSSVMPEAVNK